MLKFWKSSARGKSKNCPRPPEPTNEELACSGSVNNLNELNCSPTKHPVSWDDVITRGQIVDLSSHNSRLSKTFDEVLIDRHSLSYLRQYLDSISFSNLIEFWIQAENFHTVAKNFSKEKSKLKDQQKLKPQQHSTINRTVSFDSSVKKFDKGFEKLNGFAQESHYNSDVKFINEWRQSTQFSASCSHIVPSDEWCSVIPVINSKEDLLAEAVRIFKKFIALESPQRLDLPDDVRSSIISAICHPEGHVDPNIFRNVQNIICKEIQVKHFDNFLQSEYYCKYQIDVLTSGSLTIEDILFNQMALFYFTEYLEQEQMSVILEFVLAVINFKDQINLVDLKDVEQIQNDAIILYEKYFSLQATSPLGFGSGIRLEVEENICRDGGPLANCFHKPFRLALVVLQQCIDSFTSSSLYFKYLSEMIGTIEGSIHSMKHKKSYSDCSSEISVSVKNTLLAMEDNRKRHSTSMRIDSKQLYNGDLLWRRKTDKGLCLGRINSLGRFESSMEPDPEKKDSSVIKRVVNRLVSGEKEKAKEELAWQVAHMIVKDVTDVTMGMPDSNL